MRYFSTDFDTCPLNLYWNIEKKVRGRLQRTSGKWGGGGFEISDIPGRGELEGGGL